MKKRKKTKQQGGSSPYRQTVSMTRTASVRDQKRRERKQAKRNIEGGKE